MDAGAKDKELLLLRDKNPRYTLRERLFILCHMQTFRIPRRRVTEYFAIARSVISDNQISRSAVRLASTELPFPQAS
jgi:hypothetical protein